ncbi:MAG: type II toxin-antitoxin system HicB family antitoxin [Ruminococcus sp.]|nr:type II toxin-antitoxin system HicB family antitoxin [Ruminococcus sp.]
MKTLYYYPAVLQKEENGYSVWLADIAGCNSFGDTVTEAIERNCSKAVKKTLTIPMHLNELAEKEHINFSSVLREALERRLNIN